MTWSMADRVPVYQDFHDARCRACDRHGAVSVGEPEQEDGEEHRYVRCKCGQDIALIATIHANDGKRYMIEYL